MDVEVYVTLKMDTMPFHRNGEWAASLSLCDWHSDEIELFQELTNRIFPRLERVRAEMDLRESEEKY